MQGCSDQLLTRLPRRERQCGSKSVPAAASFLESSLQNLVDPLASAAYDSAKSSQREGSMRTAVLRTSFTCGLVFFLCFSVNAGESVTAILYPSGPAMINGTDALRTSALFAGDRVETGRNSV